MTEWFSLLAQTATAPAPTNPGGAVSGGAVFWRQIFPLLLVVAVFWWFMSRGRSKERQKYEDMLNALKRSDRVMTIGGIIGTVVDVRDNEIVLKVDETNNVKMRFVRSAIKEVLRDTPAETKG